MTSGCSGREKLETVREFSFTKLLDKLGKHMTEILLDLPQLPVDNTVGQVNKMWTIL